MITINTICHFNLNKRRMLFYIVFNKGKKEEYEKFLSQYDPRYGFTIIPYKNLYYIFCGGLRFKCSLWENKRTQSIIGFDVKHCDPITQTETIDCATRGISFSNFSKEKLICIDNIDRFYVDNKDVPEYYRSMRNILSLLQEHCSKKEKNSFDVRDSSLLDTYEKFWKTQRAIVEAKKEYTKKTLIQFEYSKFEPCDTMTSDGILYKFNIEPLINIVQKNEQRFTDMGVAQEIEDPADVKSFEALKKEYSDKLSDSKSVVLPRAMATDENVPGITGTIYAYDAENNVLFVEVKNKTNVSSNEIAPNGIICEKMSSDLRKQQETIDSLLNLSDDNKWEAINSIVIDKKLEKVDCLIPALFESNRLTDNQKDAIKKALNAKDFLLVQGPPGTGKTTIIVEMIRNFVNCGQKVLVCSKNNLAVDNVLEKWIKENKDRAENHICVRLTASEDSIKVPLVAQYTPDKVTARIQSRIFESSSGHHREISEKVINDVELLKREREKLKDLYDICIIAYRLYQSVSKLSSEYEFVLKKAEIFKLLGLNLKSGSLLIRYNETQDLKTRILKNVLKPILRIYTDKNAPSTDVTKGIYESYQHICTQLDGLLGEEYDIGIIFSLILMICQNHLPDKKEHLRGEFSRFTNAANIIQNLRLFPGNSLNEHKDFKVLLDKISSAKLTNASIDKTIADLSSLSDAMESYHYTQSLKLNHIREVLSEWHKELLSTESRQLEQLLVCNSVKVVGATCMSVRSDEDFKDATYDVVIVDEAGQITLHDIIVPITKAKKVILIGDHLQLPPMNEKDFISYYLKATEVNSGEIALPRLSKEELEDIFNVSLFEKLYNQGATQGDSDDEENDQSPKVMINAQYRMHPSISKFISKHFYKGKYVDGVGITPEQRFLSIAGRDKPIYFYDTKDHPNKGETIHDPGCSNDLEAELCSDILVDIIDAIEKGNYKMREKASLAIKDEAGNIVGYDIGVISGYSKQVDLIKDKTRTKLIERLELNEEEADARMNKFMVNSVDSFQGRDNEIILFSMTRSNPKGKIGFLRDVRRLNVAMTRAKSMLIMIGDSETLTASKQMAEHNKNIAAAYYYESLIDYCSQKENNFYHKVT